MRDPVIYQFTNNPDDHKLQQQHDEHDPRFPLAPLETPRQEIGHEPGQVITHVPPGLIKETVTALRGLTRGLFLSQLIAHKPPWATCLTQTTPPD